MKPALAAKPLGAASPRRDPGPGADRRGARSSIAGGGTSRRCSGWDSPPACRPGRRCGRHTDRRAGRSGRSPRGPVISASLKSPRTVSGSAPSWRGRGRSLARGQAPWGGTPRRPWRPHSRTPPRSWGRGRRSRMRRGSGKRIGSGSGARGPWTGASGLRGRSRRGRQDNGRRRAGPGHDGLWQATVRSGACSRRSRRAPCGTVRASAPPLRLFAAIPDVLERRHNGVAASRAETVSESGKPTLQVRCRVTRSAGRRLAAAHRERGIEP